MPKHRPKLKLGDIVELTTAKGLAYAQYVNQHTKPPKFGTLMRILPGTFAVRPTDFVPLVNAEGSYCCFWPASSDIREGRVQVVANVVIPKEHRKFPLFKWGIASLKTGRVRNWEIWDPRMRNSRPVARLTHEQIDLPLEQIVPLEHVKARIERGWHPRDACDGDQGRPIVSKLPPPKLEPNSSSKPTVTLFENDAAWDAWGEIKDDGIRYVRAAIVDAKKLARRGELDREPANAILAIAAIMLAKRGKVPQELRTGHSLDEIIESLPDTISARLLNELIQLIEEVRVHSEVQQFWKDEGLEREWSRKVGTITRQLTALVGATKRRTAKSKQ